MDPIKFTFYLIPNDTTRYLVFLFSLLTHFSLSYTSGYKPQIWIFKFQKPKLAAEILNLTSFAVTHAGGSASVER